MQTFSYKPSFSYGYLILIILGVVAIYFGLMHSFTLGIRRLELLVPPHSNYAAIFIGVFMVLMGLYYLLKWGRSKGTDTHIHFTIDGIYFPQFQLHGPQKKKIQFADVTELYQKSDDNGFSVIIYTAQEDRFEFDSAYFENEKAYKDFSVLINQYCGK